MTLPEETLDTHPGGRPSKFRRYLTRSAVVAAYLVAGIFILFLGTSLDKHHHPGYRASDTADPRDGVTPNIYFQVDDNGGLIFAPAVNDIIEWDAVDWRDGVSTAPLDVTFAGNDGNGPCKPASGPRSATSPIPANGICIVTDKLKVAHHRYNCTASDGSPCIDPALGPRSRSQGGGSIFNDVEEFDHDVSDFVLTKFGLSDRRGARPRQQPTPAKVDMGAFLSLRENAAPALAVDASDASVKFVRVTCGTDGQTTTLLDDSDNVSDTFTVTPPQTLYWSSTTSQAPSENLLFFNQAHASTPKLKGTPATIQFGNTMNSIVYQSAHRFNSFYTQVPQGAPPSSGQGYPYTITDFDCSTKPTTAYIVVNSQQANHAPHVAEMNH